LARHHPIKAKSAKADDAKLWVYRRESDHDRQAAEDHKQLCLFGLASYSQVFLSDGYISSCNPVGTGLQKEKSHVS
jgi:hypothetical protein